MRSRRQRQLKKKISRVFIFFTTSTALFYTVFVLLFVHNTKAEAEVISPLPKESPSILKIETQAMPKSSPILKRIIDTALAGSNGNYGIVIKNLRTGETYMQNEHTVYQTASLYKLWVMAATYQQIETGKLKETTVLSQDVKVLNDKFALASESAELHEGTITNSVAGALTKMITISDNYSALLLTAKVGLKNIANLLKDNSLAESKVGTTTGGPQSTPADIAMTLEKMYKGELVSASSSAQMIGTMKAQRLNKKLPKYLPTEIKMAHKTGELGSYSHDAGIVYMENGDYIIVAMSQTNSQTAANERIAEISKNVYTYFASESGRTN